MLNSILDNEATISGGNLEYVERYTGDGPGLIEWGGDLGDRALCLALAAQATVVQLFGGTVDDVRFPNGEMPYLVFEEGDLFEGVTWLWRDHFSDDRGSHQANLQKLIEMGIAQCCFFDSTIISLLIGERFLPVDDHCMSNLFVTLKGEALSYVCTAATDHVGEVWFRDALHTLSWELMERNWYAVCRNLGAILRGERKLEMEKGMLDGLGHPLPLGESFFREFWDRRIEEALQTVSVPVLYDEAAGMSA